MNPLCRYGLLEATVGSAGRADPQRLSVIDAPLIGRAKAQPGS